MQAPEEWAARGSGSMPHPRKFLKSRGLEILFPAFSKSYFWFTHIVNYLPPTLSQQTNAHWREYNTCNVNYKIEKRLSLYLETSKCFTFQSHLSKFIVSLISGLVLVFGCLILLCITLRMLKNGERSTNVIVLNLSGDIYVICRLGGPFSEKLWPRSWNAFFIFFSKLSNEKKNLTEKNSRKRILWTWSEIGKSGLC